MSKTPASGPERPRLRLGISACLLGEKVRYDGGHKRDAFISDRLSRFVDFVPVCPEVEAGLGTPRESIRLVTSSQGLRLRGVRSGTDHTDPMARWTERRVDALARERLDGYLFKKDSPSCGMTRVKVFGTGGAPSREGRGVFAGPFQDRFPLLPVEEEGRLNDADLRRSFLTRLYAGRRLRDLFGGRWSRGALIAFHSAEKLLLLAHEPEAYRELGRLAAQVKALPRDAFAARYQARFMSGLRKSATRGRQANVLQHAAGYFKDRIGAADRKELAEAIDEFRRGAIPLEAPLALLRHYVRRFEEEYLQAQSWLDPFPRELASEID